MLIHGIMIENNYTREIVDSNQSSPNYCTANSYKQIYSVLIYYVFYLFRDIWRDNYMKFIKNKAQRKQIYSLPSVFSAIFLSSFSFFPQVNQTEEKTVHTAYFETMISEMKSIFSAQPKIVFILLALTICIFSLLLIIYFMFLREEKHHFFKIAYIDELTGMHNLHWFEENVPKIIAREHEKKFAVLSANINRFDIIRNCYGEETSNSILNYCARIVGEECRSHNGYAARANSDYFLCLIPYQEKEFLKKDLEGIEKKYEGFSIKSQTLILKWTFGICLLPQNCAIDIKKAINAATVARKEADVNFSPIVFFNEQMLAQINLRESIRNFQEQALQQQEFEVYFQPKYHMKDRSLVGAEALIRWNSKEIGFLSPAQFIPIFENNGFILKLDFFVLKTVLSFLEKREKAGKRIVPISVNQSRVHLNDEKYVEDLRKLFLKFDLPTGMIELELTETAFSDIQNAQKIMNEIRQLGFLTSIDDFGAGYSSLLMLNAVPIDILKLDRFFLTDSCDSERTREILSHIVSMANALNIRIICEGVETNSQAEFLMSVGCNFAQGYLYGKPMPQKDFEQLLDQTSNLMVNDSDSFAIKASDMIGMTASEQIAI